MAALKKEDPFYTLIKDFSKVTDDAVEEYVAIVNGYPETASRIPKMKIYESAGDEICKNIMDKLYTSFITPFDREDIADLALAIDDVLDELNGVTVRLDLFNASETRVEAKQMAELTRSAMHEMSDMLNRLPDYKNDPTVRDKARAIGAIEDEGDTVYQTALYRLFHEKASGRESLVWLRLFDRMENALNAISQVAKIVRRVVIKSA